MFILSHKSPQDLEISLLQHGPYGITETRLSIKKATSLPCGFGKWQRALLRTIQMLPTWTSPHLEYTPPDGNLLP